MESQCLRRPPGATGFIALGRGMALLSSGGEASRRGRIVVTFLKALIDSAPDA